MPRSLSLVAAGAAALLVLSGCGPDEPTPNYSSVSAPPTSSSPTASDTASPTAVPSTGPNVSPGEVAPTLPASAMADTSAAALAYEGYYIKLVDWVYATSQPEILASTYAPTCVNCTNFMDNLTKQVADGQTFRGSRITIERLGLVTNDARAGAEFAISVEITATALEIVDSTGAVTDSGPATTLTLTNWLKRSGNAWLIVDQGKA